MTTFIRLLFIGPLVWVLFVSGQKAYQLLTTGHYALGAGFTFGVLLSALYIAAIYTDIGDN